MYAVYNAGGDPHIMPRRQEKGLLLRPHMDYPTLRIKELPFVMPVGPDVVLPHQIMHAIYIAGLLIDFSEIIKTVLGGHGVNE